LKRGETKATKGKTWEEAAEILQKKKTEEYEEKAWGNPG